MKKINLLLIIFLIHFSITNAQNHKISLKLEKGKTYNLQTQSQSAITQSVMGQDMKIGVLANSSTAYTVMSKVKNEYDLEVMYKKIGMTMSMSQGAEMKYNSENQDQKDPVSKMLASLTNKPIHVKITDKGKVLEIKGLNELMDSLATKMSLSDASMLQMKEMLKKSFGEESFKNNIGMAISALPSNEVKIGAVWSDKKVMNISSPLNVNTNYTLKDVTKDTYVITGNSMILTDESNSKPLEMNGVKMKVQLNGNMISEITLDKKTGWLIDAHYDQNLKGKNSIEKSEKIPQAMEIPMTIVNKITITH